MAKTEYKQVHLNISPPIKYAYFGDNAKRERTAVADAEAERRILEMLKPYFDEGWQLDGSFKAAVSLNWGSTGVVRSHEQLKDATARLIRYV